MSIPHIVLGIAVILSVIYGILGMLAFRHIRAEERASRSYLFLLTDTWWPFYDDRFHDSARRLLFFGKLLLPVIVVAYIFAFVNIDSDPI